MLGYKVLEMALISEFELLSRAPHPNFSNFGGPSKVALSANERDVITLAKPTLLKPQPAAAFSTLV